MYGQAGVVELYLKFRMLFVGALLLVVPLNGLNGGLCSVLNGGRIARRRTEEKMDM